MGVRRHSILLKDSAPLLKGWEGPSEKAKQRTAAISSRKVWNESAPPVLRSNIHLGTFQLWICKVGPEGSRYSLEERLISTPHLFPIPHTLGRQRKVKQCLSVMTGMRIPAPLFWTFYTLSVSHSLPLFIVHSQCQWYTSSSSVQF